MQPRPWGRQTRRVQSAMKAGNYCKLPADAASASGKANSPSTVREEDRQLQKVAR
jgi:hypothetical protein